MSESLPPVYKLSELNGKLVRMIPGKRQSWREEKDIRKADGVQYLCPVCFHRNGGSKGTESILNWFLGRGVPASWTPGPGRWNVKGTGLDDLTFVEPGSYSVNITGHWHGFVENGTVRVDQVHPPQKAK
jgi:hypothetical protein